MKLKELRAIIAKLPKKFDSCEIILQRDPEGNGYSPLEGVDENVVKGQDDGDIFRMKYSASDNCMEEKDWEELKNNPKNRVIVLWPTY